jgi:hypothetical protein
MRARVYMSILSAPAHQSREYTLLRKKKMGTMMMMMMSVDMTYINFYSL